METNENRQELLKELRDIKNWEKAQQKVWFWERLGRLPFKILDKLTPAFIQNKLGRALDELGGYIQSGGRYLISKKTVLKKFDGVDSLEDIRHLPLGQMDEAARRYAVSRARFAKWQGATTGVGGYFTLAIDIPALLGLSLKILQEIAICYGYDPYDKAERLFIVKCLQFASADVVGKKAVLDDLEQIDKEERQHRTVTQLQSWREVIMTYRENYGWKKLFQLVPIAGIVFGAIVNKSTLENVAETGMMLYRKRRILEKLEAMKKPSAKQ
ncbi:MAG TPA: EcsC family protein [Bacillales bacterium]|nr:EcsC family protein [Bacillales bacterium]